MKVESGKS